MTPCALFSHPSCHRHLTGPGHPEAPQRLTAIDTALQHHGLHRRLRHEQAPPAPWTALCRAHAPAYLEALRDAVPTQGLRWIDADTPLSPASWEAALHASGAAVAAVEALLEARIQRAFCAVRPPGHHAERARAMGFCLVNHIAVAALHAHARGLAPIAVVDIDVHHGNGSEDILQGHPHIHLFSAYRHPHYPYRDERPPAANVHLLPLPAGTDGAAYLGALRAAWDVHLDALRPRLLLVSAGFDTHRDDPLGGLALRTEDYRRLAAWLLEHARKHAQGRLISVLEGGYHLPALGESVAAYLDPQC